MAERITQQWISERIKKTIDQYFQEYKYMSKEYVKQTKDTVVGAILQVALHQLPTDKYFEIKQYCYDKYGYDPGGLQGQYTLEMLMEEQDARTDELP